MRPLKVLVCFVLLSALLLLWAYILRSVWTKESKARSFFIKGSVPLAIFIYLFLALEIIFYSCFALSDTFSFTLASQLWMERYWQPINSLGYRDVEHTSAEFAGKEVLFVVGDSFVAGHGIARIENRFSNILQRNLGGRYVVVNVAQNGWDTTDEYQAILAYPYRPKRIVLAYYINDILGAADKSGYGSPIRVEYPGNPVRQIIAHSYTLNFAYWRLYRFYHRDVGAKYWSFLTNAYANPKIWAAHETELLKLVSYTRQQGIDLTVVIFPNLVNVTGSKVFTAHVAEFFQQHNVRTLNLEPRLEQRDTPSLVVNSLDAHPNEALHKEVADLLTEELSLEAR